MQKKLPLINSAHGSETRNIINELIKLFNGMGYTYDEALQKAHDVLNEAKQTNNMNKNVQKQINTLIAESGTSDSEVLQARIDAEGNEYPVLKNRLDENDAQLAQNVQNIESVHGRVDGIDRGYGGTYATLADLEREFPTGDTKRYVVTDDGNWYYWNDSSWVSGGIFQATGFDDSELYSTLKLPPPFPKVKLNNSVVNSNFEDAWIAKNAVSSAVGNIGSFTATRSGGRIEGYFNGVEGDKYYIKAHVKSTSNQVGFHVAGLDRLYHSGSGEFEDISSIISPTVSSSSLSIRVFDNRSSGWDEVNVAWVVAINLTSAFGSGNEPTIEQVEMMLSQYPNNWFEGIKSVGKNYETIGMTFMNVDGKMVMQKPSEIPLTGSPLEGKKGVSFGDSLHEFGNIPEVISEKSGATIYDVSVGGTRLVYHGSVPNYDDFSFVKLVEAIIANNFSLQETAHQNMVNSGDDNTKNFNTLKSINWNEIDFITFMYGTNDYKSNGVIIGETGSTTTKRDINGSLNYVFQNFFTTFPHIKIYALTPIYHPGGDSDNTPGSSGLYLYEVSQAIQNKAKEYHTPCLDLYNNSGINQYNANYYISSDGTHPSQEGYEMLGERIAKFLMSI